MSRFAHKRCRVPLEPTELRLSTPTTRGLRGFRRATADCPTRQGKDGALWHTGHKILEGSLGRFKRSQSMKREADEQVWVRLSEGWCCLGNVTLINSALGICPRNLSWSASAMSCRVPLHYRQRARHGSHRVSVVILRAQCWKSFRMSKP